MSVILFVRISSNVDSKELEQRAIKRKPEFLEIPGLIQKIYGRDPESGDWCGIYFFESKEALAAFRETELAKTIPLAYEATEVRREIFEVMYPLKPNVGPIES
jgi:hypothetical protein